MQESSINLAGIRVLVVDDDENIRLLVHRILTSRSAAVEVAENGRSALQILLRQDFDVVIVDLLMQEMDGLTFMHEARNIWPWLRFVVQTGDKEPTLREEVSKIGAIPILEKPVKAEILREIVLREYNSRATISKDTGQPVEQQHQLRLLGHLSETALAAGTFVDALREMSDGLGELMACDMAGLFGFSEGQNVMVFCPQHAVPETYLDMARDEILRRYKVLSGKTIDPESLRVQVEGVLNAARPSDVAPYLMTIPLLAHNEVQGILMLAYREHRKLTTNETAFVYHVANVFSSILTAVTRIRQMAAHDSLTNLYNRAYFDDQTERALQMARRHGYSMAMAIMDLDHFKTINDTHGHPVGDVLLCEFAQIIRHVARTSDVVARHGGDEFVALFPQTELPFAAALGERIRKAVEDHVFCADSLRLKVTTSIGLSTSRDIGPTAPVSEMMRLADVALYEAKRHGRNTVRLWSAGKSMETESKVVPAVRAPRILVLDDEVVITKVVEAVLKGAGYQTVTACSAAEAISKVKEDKVGFDVIITDLTLPESNGLEVIAALHKMDRFLMAIVMTGFATKENAVASLREGAFDFIEKPIVPGKLLTILGKALELRTLRVENERYRLHLEDMVRQKSASLMEAMDQLKQSYDFSLQAMVGLLDMREHNTGQHCTRVMALSKALGKAMEVTGKDLDSLGHGALLHDIGKIAVPDNILLKPGPLTEEEWVVMRTHASVGYKILSASAYLKEVAEIVHAHHERFDGKGYPRGLKGTDICLGARIFAVVDAYDAMRSDRPYRRSMTREASATELRVGSGVHFDPTVVEVFLKHQDQMESIGAWTSQ